MRAKKPIISLQYVSSSYEADPLDYKNLVLKNVSLDIYEGEFIIVFGPSGSGKSTILNLIAGLEFCKAGAVKVHNRNLAHLTDAELARYHRLKIGIVFQAFNLIKSLLVWENVALPQAASGVRYNTRHKRALRLLRLLHIDAYANKRVTEISGGEQQRVAIARALINKPFIMLVDEPTGNLDSKSADEVMRIIHDLHYKAKHTIVLVTHNPDYLHFATRVIYVRDGQVVKEERPGHDAEAVPPALPEDHLEKLATYKTTSAEAAKVV